MGDEKHDCALLAQPFDETHQPFDLVRPEGRCRFVEQKDLRLPFDGAYDFQHLLGAEW